MHSDGHTNIIELTPAGLFEEQSLDQLCPNIIHYVRQMGGGGGGVLPRQHSPQGSYMHAHESCKSKKKKNFGRGQGALNIEECPCQEVFGVDKFGIKQVCQQRNGWSLTASARVTYSCSGHFVHHEGTGCRYKAWALLEHSSWFKFVICETWHCWVLDHVTFSVLQRSLSTCSWAWSPSSSGEELVYTRLQWSMLPVQYGGCGHFWLFYMS